MNGEGVNCKACRSLDPRAQPEISTKRKEGRGEGWWTPQDKRLGLRDRAEVQTMDPLEESPRNLRWRRKWKAWRRKK